MPEAGYDEGKYRTNPIGSGPFKMVQWDKGQQVIIEPNEKYYGTISPFKQITVLFLDGEAALANAQSGLLDVAMVSPEYATANVNGMHLVTLPTIDTRGFNLPTQPETTKDGKTIGKKSAVKGMTYTKRWMKNYPKAIAQRIIAITRNYLYIAAFSALLDANIGKLKITANTSK